MPGYTVDNLIGSNTQPWGTSNFNGVAGGPTDTGLVGTDLNTYPEPNGPSRTVNAGYTPVITITQTGTARIVSTVTKTQTAVSRIVASSYLFDTFTATNGTSVSGHTPDVGAAWGGGVFTITSNAASIPGNFQSQSGNVSGSTAGTADYDVSIDLLATASSAGSDKLGVQARGNFGAGNYYGAYYNAGYSGTGQEVRLSKYVGNGETVLGTYSLSYVQNVTHNLKLRMQGSTISVLIDGATVISLTDTTYGSGTSIGIFGATTVGNSLAADNILVTDVSGTPPSIKTQPATARILNTAVTRTQPATARIAGTGAANGYVQSNAHTSTGSTTVATTLASAITGGNLLVADVCFHSGGQTVSISDGHNTWVPIGSAQQGVGTLNGAAIQQFYAANVAAGTYAITATRSGATGFLDIAVLEVAGRATSSPLDAHAYNNPTGNTSATSASITPSVNGCYIQSFIGNDTTAVNGVNAPFTERENANFDGNSVDDYLQTTAASVSATWTMNSGNANQITAIAAFLPAVVLTKTQPATARISKVGATKTQVATANIVAPSGGPVTFDAVGPGSSGASISAAASLSWSHTCSGTNRLLTVVGIWDPNTTPDTGVTMSATYNGVAMTSDGTQRSGNDHFGFVQMWHLVNPPTGANTVVITASATPDFGLIGGSVSFNNVDQTTPVQNFTTSFDNGGGSGTTSTSITVSSATNNMVVTGTSYGGGSTPTASQTVRWSGGLSGTFGAANHAAQATAAGSSSVVTTFTGSGADYWGSVGMDIRAATGGGPSTKTQPAIARLSVPGLTKTQAATARVSAPLTKTQPATARIRNTAVAKTQPASARVIVALTKTQPETARIQTPGLTKTQPAISRVSIPGSRTQAAQARVSALLTSAQPAIAKIAVAGAFTNAQPAVARIRVAGLTKPQPAIARVAVVFPKTQGATARIRNTAVVNAQGATARITEQRTTTQGATARLRDVGLTRTQGSTARISKGLALTQPAIVRIQIPGTITQPALARLRLVGLTKTQPAIAKLLVSGTPTITQTGTARIRDVGLTRTQPAIARVQITGPTATKTQSAQARVSGVGLTKTQGATARIRDVGLTLAQPAIAKIVVASSGTKTQPAIARVAVQRSSPQPARATIVVPGSFTRTQPATARIRQPGLSTAQQAQARLQKTLSTAQAALSRVQTSGARTQQAITRIRGAGGVSNQPATARIRVTGSSPQPATARISAGLTKTQPAITRVAILGSRGQPALARIRNTQTQATTHATTRLLSFGTLFSTTHGIARISLTRSMVQHGLARMAVVETRTQPARARILAKEIRGQCEAPPPSDREHRAGAPPSVRSGRAGPPPSLPERT